jgi:hypothetical protein
MLLTSFAVLIKGSNPVYFETPSCGSSSPSGLACKDVTRIPLGGSVVGLKEAHVSEAASYFIGRTRLSKQSYNAAINESIGSMVV